MPDKARLKGVQTPLKPPESSAPALPHSVEAEQQLLGAVLLNNDVLDRVADLLAPAHFYEPLHGRIYELACGRAGRGQLASPVTLKPFLEDDVGLAEVGGPAYLVRMAGSAISAFAARDYAQMIYDAAVRRDLMALGQDLSDQASRADPDAGPSALIETTEQKLYDLAEHGGGRRDYQSLLAATTDAVRTAAAAYKRDGGLAGVSTGLADLDRKLGGLHPSDLLIIAGRPSMGKTALATNIAFNVARAYTRAEDGTAATGGMVGMASLEMSAVQLATRILSGAAGLPSDQIQRGALTEAEFGRFVDAAKTLQSCPLYIDDTPAQPIAQIAARARRQKRKHGLDLLIVDYLQLVRPTRTPRNRNRTDEVAEITQGLKAIAKELNIPVIALSQLSRAVETREDKRPQLADLRDSGAIEQDADVVMFVFREEYYAEREKPADDKLEQVAKWQDRMDRLHARAEVIVSKQRRGPIGTIGLTFEAHLTRFSTASQPWQGGP